MPGDIDLSQFTGLSESEAARRLAADGPNRLPQDRPRSWFAAIRDTLREPMFLLLLACVVVYAVLGDLGEAALLSIMVLVVLGLTLAQSHRTETALAALRGLAQPMARVIRDGTVRAVAGPDVVRGDWLVLAEGDRVPADGVLRAVSNLGLDESLLTGESVPVAKRLARAGEVLAPEPGGEDSPYVYAGTLVVRGLGVAEVVATGPFSAIGRIGVALGSIGSSASLLQRDAARLVRFIGSLALLVCGLVLVWLGLERGDWVQAVLAALALGISLVPEEVPVVMTIFIAMGAWRIAQQRVLARRLPAVEALGAMTVLALDKTGTLTENRMSVVRLVAPTAEWAHGEDIDDELHRLLEFAALASHRNPFDPMELAIGTHAARELAATEHLHHDWTHLREYPLSSELLAVSHAWSGDASGHAVAAKGAPEAICDLCHLQAERRAEVLASAQQLAGEGLRVLGVAAGKHRGPLPSRQHDFDFEFLGLVGLADPLRAEAASAIAQLHRAGVRVVMITGDYPATALAIARAAGIARTGHCLTGAQIEALPAHELQRRVAATDVYARVSPTHKLRIVQAFQAAGEVVAMTGDGVNDAPALRAADIGVAMGRRGAEVCREAAALVLLEDDFGAIVSAVRLGRRIYANLRKAMGYIVSVHVMIAGVALMPILLGGPLILMPAQIVFLQLVIDPACSIAFEADPETPGAMERPPRPRGERLLGWSPFLLALAAGIAALAAVVTVNLGLGADSDQATLRSAAFTTMLLANLALIVGARAPGRSPLGALRGAQPSLWWVLVLGSAGMALVLALEPLRALFSFAPLAWPQLGAIAAAVVALVLALELLGRIRA